MIKPKDKAKELVNVFYNETYDISNHWSKSDREQIFLPIAKQCALKSVDEIIEHTHYFFDELSKDGLPNMFGDELDYWESVKYEIKSL